MNEDSFLSLVRDTTFVVVDFETVTPKGRPPEPLELYASNEYLRGCYGLLLFPSRITHLHSAKSTWKHIAAMRLLPGLVVDPTFQFSCLIRPPADAPLTVFDTQQTGIRAQDIADAPDAATVLRHFDEYLGQDDLILVAHNARYEAAIFQRFSACCPQASTRSFLDTVALGKYLEPGLPNYKLDTLAQHFRLSIPTHRHRALPDVELTIQILRRLLQHSMEKAPQATAADVLRTAGLVSPQAKEEPIQISLW